MKSISFISILIIYLLVSCNIPNSITNVSPKNFDWLTGKWMRTNDNKSSKTYQDWIKLDSLNYIGHGYIIKNQDTIWQENLTLVKRDSNWIYSAQTQENNSSVEFKLTKHDNQLFVVENPKHDFPTKLKYWRKNSVLNAEVSGYSKVIKYEFKQNE